MSKHSPGPWTCEKPRWTSPRDARHIYGSRPGDLIARIGFANAIQSENEAIANGEFIAQAVNMHDALIDALVHIHGGPCNDDPCPHEAIVQEALELQHARNHPADPPKREMPNPTILAAEFSKVIRQWLTPSELKQVRQGNADAVANGKTGICCTGDFCDSNMAMDAAFRTLGFGHLLDAEDFAADEEICGVWNEAWGIAKAKGFKR